ncbi:MAG: hypothetical protein ABR597_01435 [Bacteroidales bacterium]
MKKRIRQDFNTIYLFLGLLLGFFLGSTVVYWHFDRQNDRIVQEAVDRIIAIFSDNSTSETINLNELNIKGESSKSNNDLSENALTEIENPPIYSILPDFDNNNYAFARDILVERRIISVPMQYFEKSSSEKMLESEIGADPVNQNTQVFHLEFWESPLNSVGYKMSKTRIVFYGIKTAELASIQHHNGKFYLNYMNDFYPIEFTTTFKPLVPEKLAELPE